MPEQIDKEELFKQLKAKKEKMDRVRRLTSLVAGMTSLIAIAVSVLLASGLFFGEKKVFSREELSLRVSEIERSNNEQVIKIANIQTELENISSSLQTISNLPKGAEWKAEASKLTHQLSDVSNRMSALESALTVDPSKALAVPILRKDLDNAEKGLRAELTQTRDEINRIYDQNKWFIGLMFTIALSVLGMAVSSIFNRRDT